MDHSHGIVIFPISIFLIWQRRDRLASVSVDASLAGSLAVLVLVVVWVVARLAAVELVEHAAAIAMIPAAVTAVFGCKFARRIAFPLLFLGFAIPFSDLLVPPLMAVTADISTFLLSLFGIPHFREGQYLSLPGGNFVVADVCSGTRYLMSGMIITSIYANMYFRSTLRQILFIAGTAVVLIIANGIRAFLVMSIASASNLKYLGGNDHIVFGWLLFGVIVFGLMWFGGRYASEPLHSKPATTGGEGSAPTRREGIMLAIALVAGMLAVTIRPWLGEWGAVIIMAGVIILVAGLVIRSALRSSGVDVSSDSSRSNPGLISSISRFTPAVVALIALAIGPLLAKPSQSTTNIAPGSTKVSAVSGCSGPLEWREDWRPQMANAASETSASFSCQDVVLSVFVAAYGAPAPGAELIGSSNRLFPEVWDRYKSGFVQVGAGDDASRPVLKQEISLPDDVITTWHWYEVGASQETSGSIVKMRQLWALLARQPAGGRVVVLSVRGASDVDEANELLGRAADQVVY